MKTIYYLVYKLLLTHLPSSVTPIIGSFLKKLRYTVCKRMFKECGKNVNVETGASFGYGAGIKIGDNSGLGISCRIPNNIHIGNNVMMGPHVTIYSRNHAFERIDLPMNKQGFGESKQTIIEDDVWIGSHVIMTPGRHIKKGTIIGAGTVLTKDFPEYSVVGGNPGKLLKKRNNNNNNNPEKDHSTFDV